MIWLLLVCFYIYPVTEKKNESKILERREISEQSQKDTKAVRDFHAKQANLIEKQLDELKENISESQRLMPNNSLERVKFDLLRNQAKEMSNQLRNLVEIKEKGELTLPQPHVDIYAAVLRKAWDISQASEKVKSGTTLEEQESHKDNDAIKALREKNEEVKKLEQNIRQDLEKVLSPAEKFTKTIQSWGLKLKLKFQELFGMEDAHKTAISLANLYDQLGQEILSISAQLKSAELAKKINREFEIADEKLNQALEQYKKINHKDFAAQRKALDTIAKNITAIYQIELDLYAAKINQEITGKIVELPTRDPYKKFYEGNEFQELMKSMGKLIDDLTDLNISTDGIYAYIDSLKLNVKDPILKEVISESVKNGLETLVVKSERDVLPDLPKEEFPLTIKEGQEYSGGLPIPSK